MKNLVIIGGGPAAMMLAAQIDRKKYKVTLYEKKKAIGRKFLVAGEGGLNLTYQSPVSELISQYTPSEFMAPIIKQFTNEDLTSWFNKLGVSTFVGSSNRVFPDLDLKPIEVLNKIVTHLKVSGIEFHLDQTWVGWNDKRHLCFEGFDVTDFDIIVFALGGASWKVTGSDGKWNKIFEDRGVEVRPFRAANCAFGVDWNIDFITAHEGKPLKNIAVTFRNQRARGELLISNYGLEGNAIYALSHKIQESLLEEDKVVVYLDLKPTMTVDKISKKLNSSFHSKISEILKKDLNLDRASIGLLKQFSDKKTFSNKELLAETIKAIPVNINSADDLDRAISTLGGIALDEIDKNFQIKKIDKAYAIGEMLDWYAPTGGYLLQACFSMGFSLASHLNAKEEN